MCFPEVSQELLVSIVVYAAATCVQPTWNSLVYYNLFRRLASPSCSVIRCIVQKELVMMNIETELVPKCFGNFGRMFFLD